MSELAAWWKRVRHWHSWGDVRSDRELISKKWYGEVDEKGHPKYPSITPSESVYEYATYQKCSRCGAERRIVDKVERVSYR